MGDSSEAESLDGGAPATRDELAALEGRLVERLASLLLASRADGSAPAAATPEHTASPGAGQASRRVAAGNGDDASAHKSDDDRATSGAASSDDSDSLLGGLGDSRAPAGGVGAAAAHRRRRHVVLHPDGFDDPDLPDPNDIITAYDIPAAIRRADGIPVPFEPVDARFLSRFKDGSADYHEAGFCYQISAWTQELSNAAVSLFYRREEFSAAALTDRLAGAAIASRQLFHLATAQYDYLEFKQRDPVGAEVYRSTEAVPRNTLRGPRGRRWLSTVARDEVRINVKAAAEERAAKHRKRRVAPKNPGGGGGGGSGGRGGGGGGGGGGRGDKRPGKVGGNRQGGGVGGGGDKHAAANA